MGTLNGQPAAGLAIELAANANAMATVTAVEAKLKSMEPFFPHGLKAIVAYDTTPFVRVSIEEVVKTLIEAIILIVLIMFIFLQSLRATLIPILAVPVVIMGTFGILSLLGYFINTLTMFAMVLAIGLLVDDAIVVVENVERVMAEQGLSPRDATRQSMGAIQSALIGIAMVLSAAFLPMAFFGGATGAIYRQFSVTIVSAMLLSVLVALTLTPALCASILKAGQTPEDHHSGAWGLFNRGFERATLGYQRFVRWMIGVRFWVLGVFLLLVALLFTHLPSSFLPTEDQGVLFVHVKLPTGATEQRTHQVMQKVRNYFEKQPNVSTIFALTGRDGQNTGRAFVHLVDWSKRTGAGSSAEAIAAQTTKALANVRDAHIYVLSPPAVHYLGNASGFKLELENLGGLSHDAFAAAQK